MSRRRTVVRRLGAIGGAALCLVAVALLWQLRPPLHHLTVAQLDAGFVGELIRLLLWLTLALLALVLLARSLRTGRRDVRSSAGHPERSASRRPIQRAKRRALLDTGAPGGAPPSSEPERYLPSWRLPQLTLAARAESGVVSSSAAAAIEAPAERATQTAETAEPVSVDASARPSVLLLGPLEIPSQARRRRRAPGPAHELIAYLALHPEGASRDELLEALWPNENPTRSEQRFWQASKEARKLLGGGIVRDSGRYRLDRGRVDVDVDRLEWLLARADEAIDELGEQELLERALALFRGRPLEGSDFRWSGGALRRLAARQLDLLDRVARARLGNGDARGALDAAERGIVADELNEGFWQTALTAEAAGGARQAVARRYEDLQRRLDERLGLQPSSETRTLYLRLLGPDR